MPPQGPNPLAYLFPAVLLVGAVLYFAYGALDRGALQTQGGEARVTGKQFTPGSATYRTVEAGGRSWVQQDRYPDAYVVTLDLKGEPTSAVVEPQLYQSLQAGDSVRVRFRRTRLSHRLLVTDLSR